MNNWKYTKFALELNLINLMLLGIIIINTKDYDVIFHIILLSVPGFMIGLVFDAYCGVIDEINKKKN